MPQQLKWRRRVEGLCHYAFHWPSWKKPHNKPNEYENGFKSRERVGWKYDLTQRCQAGNGGQAVGLLAEKARSLATLDSFRK